MNRAQNLETQRVKIGIMDHFINGRNEKVIIETDSAAAT